MKVLPGRTTVAACERCPVRTCNSRFVAARLLSQGVIRPLSRISLGVGNRNSMWVESTSMPKKVMLVVGPSTLSGATGNPRFSQIVIAFLIWEPHISDAGGPMKRKSSK